jgi:hypothetical protein
MGLDAATRAMLAEDTAQSPPDGIWDSAWVTILKSLFPSSQSYAVRPRKRNDADADLIVEVAKVTLPKSPSEHRQYRTVLVVEIKDPQQWESGKETILQQLQKQTDLTFKSTPLGIAKDKLIWIATIGPHWLYGEKQDGQRLKHLIHWHHSTFDDATCLDLEKVAELVGNLDE